MPIQSAFQFQKSNNMSVYYKTDNMKRKGRLKNQILILYYLLFAFILVATYLNKLILITIYTYLTAHCICGM